MSNYSNDFGRLALEFQNGNTYALNELIKIGTPYFKSMTRREKRKSNNKNILYEDMDSCAVLAAYKAALKYDPSKGAYKTLLGLHFKSLVSDWKRSIGEDYRCAKKCKYTQLPRCFTDIDAGRHEDRIEDVLILKSKSTSNNYDDKDEISILIQNVFNLLIRPKYKEIMYLRFGICKTMPEIAKYFQVSKQTIVDKLIIIKSIIRQTFVGYKNLNYKMMNEAIIKIYEEKYK